jgi:hypothetical protein
MVLSRRNWRLAQDGSDPVVRRQHGARIVLVAAVALDAACGITFSIVEHISLVAGLYWALEEGTTVGTGYEPNTLAGQILKAVVALTVIPLFAATFSIFTTALTAVHVHKAEADIKEHVSAGEQRVKEHVESRFRHHLGGGTDG